MEVGKRNNKQREEELDFASIPKNSGFKETFFRLCRNKAAVAGMVFWSC